MHSHTEKKNKSSGVDYNLVVPAVTCVLAVSIPAALFPEAGGEVVDVVFNKVTSSFKWLYQLFVFSVLGFIAWCAFSRVGAIRLGEPGEATEFGNISWGAMLFCAGIGISIVNWAFIEPIYYILGPALGVEAESQRAIELASMYPLFHWGVSAWAIYVLPSIPVGYALYVKRVNVFRLSDICRPIIGSYADGWFGRLIDLFVMFSIVGGIGTTLGLAVPLVSELLVVWFDIENSLLLQIIVLVVWALMFSWSVYSGLDKGIKMLSRINAFLAAGCLVFVFLAGPTVFLLDTSVNSVGLLLENFFRMSFWTDPLDKSRFIENWTVFYWAWWIALCPMVGMFIARISRGRTIKELVIHGLLWGGLGCCLFFFVWGNYSIYLEVNDILPVSKILNDQGGPAAVAEILQTLPFSELFYFAFIALSFVFLTTTVDSSAYMLASISSNNITGYDEPSLWVRLLWAFLLAFVGVGLLVVGGLKAVQTSTILVSLPMMSVIILMCFSFNRELKNTLVATRAASRLID